MMQNTGKAAPVGDRLFCCFSALTLLMFSDAGVGAKQKKRNRVKTNPFVA